MQHFLYAKVYTIERIATQYSTIQFNRAYDISKKDANKLIRPQPSERNISPEKYP